MSEPVDLRVELNDKIADQFREIKEWMKEHSNRDSNAGAGRIAIKLAHEKLKDLEEERAEMGENIKEYERRKNEYLP